MIDEPTDNGWRAWMDRYEARAQAMRMMTELVVFGRAEVSMAKVQEAEKCGVVQIMNAGQTRALPMRLKWSEFVKLDGITFPDAAVIVVTGPSPAGALRVFDIHGTMFDTHVRAMPAGDWHDVVLPHARDITSISFEPKEVAVRAGDPVRSPSGRILGRALGLGDGGAGGSLAADPVAGGDCGFPAFDLPALPLLGIGGTDRCEHDRFRFDIRAGKRGVVFCKNCTMSIAVEKLQDIGVHPEKRYDHAGNTLADEAQRLRDENTTVMAENARLRMKVESLERAKGGRR